MAEIKDLQKLIEERASKRLLKDLISFADRMRDEPLLSVDSNRQDLYLALGQKKSDNTIIWVPLGKWELYSYFGRGETPRELKTYLSRLYDYHLPKYIEQESKELLEKLDSMKEDIDNLYNQRPSC